MMRGRQLLRLAVGCSALMLAVAGCASAPAKRSGITIETLSASTGTGCPVPLDAAASAAGLDRAGTAAGTVDATRSDSTAAAGPAADPAGDPVATSALDAAGGVVVSCAVTLEGGDTLHATLVAVRRDESGTLLLALITKDAQLDSDVAGQVLNDLSRTKISDLVAIPGGEPVALMHTALAGASSSSLLVSATSLTRRQVEQVALELDRRLR